jgi:RNA polymerase sigma factor (sigma-70 family)
MRDRSGSYERYLQEIGSYERITPERAAELSCIIKANGDTEAVEDAVNELVQANLRLVVHCLNEFAAILDSAACPLTRADLVGEGNIGLIKAARTYDATYTTKNNPEGESRPVRFSTYAYQCIRSQMLRALKRSRFVHVPDQHFGHWRRMRELEEKHGDALTDEMILKKLGVSKTGLDRLRVSRHSATYMLEDMYRDDNEKTNWAEQIASEKGEAPEDEVSRKDLRRFLIKEMQTLPPRTRKIVAEMFLRTEKPTLADLARQFGFSRERARQICQRGLVMLRRRLSETLSPEEQMALFAAASTE